MGDVPYQILPKLVQGDGNESKMLTVLRKDQANVKCTTAQTDGSTVVALTVGLLCEFRAVLFLKQLHTLQNVT